MASFPDGSSRPLKLYIHTNRPLRPTSPAVRVEPTTGWWADVDANRQSVQQAVAKYKRQTSKPWNLLQAYKYHWLLQALEGLPDDEPWVMADTDTIFQCEADEMRRRFLELGSPPLVVGTERQLRGVFAPVNVDPRNRNSTEVPWSRDQEPVFANSGLLMGTRLGARKLVDAMLRVSPNFPCCPIMRSDGTLSSRCRADDQICLFAALSRQAGLRHTLDVNSSLFYSLAWQDVNSIQHRQVRRSGHPAMKHDGLLRALATRPARDERSAGALTVSVSMPGPRRVEPCVLHFAGVARLSLGNVYGRVMPGAWVPWQTNFSKFRRYCTSTRGGAHDRRRCRWAPRA